MTAVISYEAMFREWYPRLVSLGVTMTGRRDVANDVAQEAFLRAHRNWDAVSRYERPSAWVRKVAVNLLIDQQRASARERDVVDRLASAPAADTGSPTRWRSRPSPPPSPRPRPRARRARRARRPPPRLRLHRRT